MPDVKRMSPHTGRYIDDTNRVRNVIERVTGVPASIATDHAYIHKGYMYAANVGPVTLAPGASRLVLFKTPAAQEATKYIHWRPSLISTSADKLTMTLFEEPTGAAGGSAIPSANRNRIHGDPAQSVVTDNVTVTGDGLAIDVAYLGGGTGAGQARSGSEVGENNEIVMQVDTEYMIRLANGSATDNTVFLKLLWYEEDDA